MLFKVIVDVFNVDHRVIETFLLLFRLFQVVSEDDAMNWFSQYPLQLQLFYDTPPLKAESIQAIVNCICSHPDWSCAHIAVETGLRKFLKYTAFQSHINSQNEVGQTPLHLACERGDLASVKQLLDESQVRTDISDFYGDTPMHCACKHRFSALCSQLGIGVNDLNIYFCFEAHKQLDMWLIFVSQVAVLRFLCQMCRLLLERDCSVNVLNKTGESPLHILTKQGRSKAALVLLTHGADANLKDQDGNTALHLAMKMNHMDLIKVLIVFWADVEIPNNLGETPGLIAAQTSKGPKREMLLDMLSSVGVQRFLPAFPESSPPMSSTTKPQGIGNVIVSHHGMDKLLCLDGGGIKGLVLIQMLIALEQEAGQPIRELFDWVAGTSTGGILALCIIHGKPLNDLQNLYFKMKKKVFKGWRPYTKKPLEKFLKKEFGEDTKMTDVSHPRVMVTSVLADRHPCKLHIFRNYEPPYSTSDTFRPLTIPQGSSTCTTLLHIITCSVTWLLSHQLVWKAARASGAAPTYFPPMGRFLDGGLLANNPTLDAMAEIHQYNKTLNAEGKDTKKLGMVLSLGTGKSPEVEVTSLKLSCNPVKLAKSLKAANNLLKILMECCTDSDGCAVDRARAFCEMTDTLYRRLSPQLSVEVMLNEVDEDVLMNMLLETRTYLNEQRAVLQFLQLCFDSKSYLV
uniref:phospholipase A2 n=1 Tax=Gouania willdenowi TaxID=441366 RepID=A0A8C5D1W6_GOUWI